MHYRNGREAKNGDKIVSIGGSNGVGTVIDAIGILFDASPSASGGDHCNGHIAPLFGGSVKYACLCDCLHVDDLYEVLRAAGLHKRPDGK